MLGSWVCHRFGSLTMLADGFHNLSDVLAIGIALQCERLKRQPYVP